MTTTFNKDEIIEMARQAGISIRSNWAEQELEAFAKLVDAKATAKATDEANARANASWTLMCKKMVEAEREACAKIVESNADACRADGVAQMYLYSNAQAIRARGEPTSRGEQRE
jgi:hypothetical protein